MNETIKYLENKDFTKEFTKLVSTSSTIFKEMTGGLITDGVVKEMCKALIMKEMIDDKALIEAIVNDLSEKIIENTIKSI